MVCRALVAHCDLEHGPQKRWVVVGSVGADRRVKASAPAQVGDAGTLIERLCKRTDGAVVVVGFDFPMPPEVPLLADHIELAHRRPPATSIGARAGTF